MVSDRVKNTLKGARFSRFTSGKYTFSDGISPTDKNDIYRLKFSSSSNLTLRLSRIVKGANIDVVLYSLKAAKAAVLKRIGGKDFNDLTRSQINRNLKLVKRSALSGNRTEKFNLTVGSGEYFLRVYWRKGESRYRLNLTASAVPSPSPVPGSKPDPDPDPTLPPISPPTNFTQGWLTQFGTSENDYGYGISVDDTSVYLSGTSQSTLDDSYTSFAAKYDKSNGIQNWYRNPSITGSDIAFDIAVDGNGNYYIAGVDQITTTVGTTGNDPFIGKYAPNDGIQQFFNDSLGTTFSGVLALGDAASSVVLDSAGNIYIAGFRRANPASSSSQAFIAKFNTSGQLDTSFDSDGIVEFGTGSASSVTSMAIDGAGNLYVAGITNATVNAADVTNPFTGGDAFVAQFNSSSGAQVWSKTLGATEAGDVQDYARSIAVDSNGNVYITGQTEGTLSGETAGGGTDGFVAKYGTDGTLSWVNQLGTSALDEGQGITVNSSGKVFATGETNGGLFGNTALGGSDAWLAEFDPATGDVLRSTLIGTATDDEAYGIATDGSAVYLVGQTVGNLDGTNLGNYDVWVAKYT